MNICALASKLSASFKAQSTVELVGESISPLRRYILKLDQYAFSYQSKIRYRKFTAVLENLSLFLILLLHENKCMRELKQNKQT